MPANQPLWLRVVLKVERAVGEPIEAAVRSETYFDLVSTTTRVRRKVGGSRRGRLAAMPAPAQPAGRVGHPPRAPAAGAYGAATQPAVARRRRTRRTGAAVGGEMNPRIPSTLNPGDLLQRLNRDVERSVLRARNGIRYVRGTHRPALGATPKDVVWKSGKAELWRYKGGDRRYGPPVVIVHSLVSRSYILDLRPGNSTGRVPDRRRPRRVHARLGSARRARRRQRPRALRRLVPAAGARRGAARERPRRGHARRLLPGRRPRGAVRRRARGREACAT